MDLWIYSENFVLLGIVDTAYSIIWANRFRQCGDFEIYVAASEKMIDLLQEDRLVGRPGVEMVCFIEHVETITDEEDGDFLLVSGRDLRSIYDRRIIWDQTVLDCTAEDGMRQLVTDALISPAIASRKYDKLTLAAAHGYTETVSTQYTGDNLLKALEDLCAAKNFGFKITANLREGIMVADFYKGVNRTAGQRVNPRVIFSEDYGNLKGTNHTRDKASYKNVALVAGEGEGTARRRTTVSRANAPAGLHRREMYVDARDISSNDGEIVETEYMQQLEARGASDLTAAAMVESMTGSIVALQHVFGRDYGLGDMVTAIDKYGQAFDTQVLEVVETWDENGYTVTPTFG